MEPWRVYRPVFEIFQHFDEEKDPDPHLSEKLGPGPHQSDADPQAWYFY